MNNRVGPNNIPTIFNIKRFSFFNASNNRQVYNGEPTRQWASKETKSSPTVIIEVLATISVIYAHDYRYVMGSNVPNDFSQDNFSEKECNELFCMIILGVLVDCLMEVPPETHSKYFVR